MKKGMAIVDNVSEADIKEVRRPKLTQKKLKPKSPYTIDGMLFIVPARDCKTTESLLLENSAMKIDPSNPTGITITKTNEIRISEPKMDGNTPPSVIEALGKSVKKPGRKKYLTPGRIIKTMTENIRINTA